MLWCKFVVLRFKMWVTFNVIQNLFVNISHSYHACLKHMAGEVF